MSNKQTIERLRQLRYIMNERQIDAFLITDPINRMYMTGFTGSSGYVLITESRALLLTDFRYMEQAPAEAPAYEVIEHGPQPFHMLASLLAQMGLHKMAFESDHVTYSVFEQLCQELSAIEMIAASGILEQIRIVKDEQELQIMREAAQLADATFMHIQNVIRPGISEADIALELEFFMRKNGAQGTSFETIVASGPRSALPHGVASERVLQDNEFVKLDFGAHYKGYCSDITRTVFIGKPTDRHKEIYQIVLEAQLHALEHIRPGMLGKEADALARNYIRDAGYGDQFGHGLGHGLGMQIHEQPNLNPRSEVQLKPGMVVTVEPGIYIPGFGGVRIEDDIVITENGNERLTSTSKEWITIGS